MLAADGLFGARSPAGLLAVTVAALWGAPSLIGYGIAWICAMYALAVWARPRQFAFGVAAIAVTTPVAAVGPVSLANAVQFGVVTIFALLLNQGTLLAVATVAIAAEVGNLALRNREQSWRLRDVAALVALATACLWAWWAPIARSPLELQKVIWSDGFNRYPWLIGVPGIVCLAALSAIAH